jgi:NDP-sugar pyrophosphorylase family protein
MNAMILAAGLGTRLGSLGRRLPKVLIDIGGVPLLERHLAYLQRQGVGRVVINAHHHAERIQSFVDRYQGPVEVVCLVEQQLLGTAGAVRNALPLLEPGPFLVLYGDVCVDESLERMLDAHRANRAVATLAVHEAASAEGKGIVEVDPSGRVTLFAEKQSRAAGPVLINSGVYVLESDIVTPLQPRVSSDFGHDVFPPAVEQGLEVFGWRLSSPVIDIGTPEGLTLARSASKNWSYASGREVRAS